MRTATLITKISTIVLALAIAGCATGYQSKGLSGGFTDTQLDSNVWQVTFNGNGYTSVEKVRDFALLRGSELTLKNGFSYFYLQDEQQSQTNSSFSTGGSSNTYANCYGSSCTANTNYTPGQTYNIKKHGNTRIVVMLEQKPEQGFVYNARMIFDSLVQKYSLQEDVDPELLN